MATVTTNRGYTYPQATDRPRDTAGYLATLAGQVDADVALIDGLLARENDFPMAVLSTVTPQVLSLVAPINHILRFDIVEEDNFGMVDLSRDPRSITVRDERPGFYRIGAYAMITHPGGTNTAGLLEIGGDTGGMGQPIGSAAPEPLQVETMFRFQNPTFFDDPIYAQVFWTGTGTGNTITVNSARLWAYWVRDIT